jgi:hypothetical protein
VQAIGAGAMPVVRRGDVFVTRLPLDAPVEEFFDCMEHALQFLGDATSRQAPLLWVDFQDTPAHVNASRRDIPGFCCLTLSSELFASTAWRPTIWHECGHALVSGNCRFLDEGWAVWCQYQSGQPSFFPAMREEADEGDIAASIAEIPLEGFLRFDGADPAFRDIAESDDEQIAIYLRGYRLVSSLIKAAGCAPLAAAFEQIKAGADPLAVLAELAPSAIADEEARITLEGVDRAFRWVRSRHHKAGALFIPRVRRIVEAEPNGVEAWELLGRLIGSLALNLAPGDPARARLVDELDTIVQKLESLQPGSAMAEMLRGLHIVSQIGLVPGALLMSVSTKAEAHLLRARDLQSSDGDLNIALARMEMKKPFSWVADRANALAYLANAAEDPKCRWEALFLTSSLSHTPTDGLTLS